MAFTYKVTHKANEVVSIPRALADAVKANQDKPNGHGHTRLTGKMALQPTCYAGVRRVSGYSSCQSVAVVSRFIPEQPTSASPASMRYLCRAHREAPAIIIPTTRRNEWKSDFF